MNIHLAAGMLAAPDPGAGVTKVRTILLVLLGVALLWVSVSSVLKHGRRGDATGAARVTGASIMSLVPAVIGISLGAIAIGSAFLNWAIPGLTA